MIWSPSKTLSFGQNQIGGIQVLGDAQANGMVLLRIPGGRKPGIAGEDDGIDRAVLRIVDVRKRADLLLILKYSNAGERLGLAAHAKAGNNGPRTSAAKHLGCGPFHKRVGEDENAIAAEN